MSPILALLLQTIVIVAAARGVGAAFRRLGQPAVIGEMVAGLPSAHRSSARSRRARRGGCFRRRASIF
jgi:Kef-type K+ transport system membrane component KefB